MKGKPPAADIEGSAQGTPAAYASRRERPGISGVASGLNRWFPDRCFPRSGVGFGVGVIATCGEPARLLSTCMRMSMAKSSCTLL
jgi:hypothetical protein